MYSQEIQSILEKKNIRIGDKIRVIGKKAEYEGFLMPKTELGDPSCIVIKLSNGYNIGLKFEKGMNIKFLERGKPIKFKPAEVKLVRDAKKPDVSILGCGGTIASRVEYTTGAVFPSFSPGDLLLSFPELNEIANISGRKLYDLFSEDITTAHWQIIAKEVAKEVKAKADGVVLMHGTDTMHYTAAALSFMLQQSPVPIVIVGAQRSSDRGSSDNLVNLVSATTVAVSDIAEVSVCMHGSMNDDYCFIHQGTKVRKLHTSRRDAFQSVNVLPYAKVWYEGRRIEYLREDYKKRGEGKLKIDEKMNPNVGLLLTYPGIKPELVEVMAKVYDGIVIAGTGLGHIPSNPQNDSFAKSIIPSVKAVIDSGIPVVIAPQTIFGRINMNVYSAGRLLNATGIIGNNCDWMPETALVKLMWVLGHTKDMKKVKEMMLANVAGEISQRTDMRGFV